MTQAKAASIPTVSRSGRGRVGQLAVAIAAVIVASGLGAWPVLAVGQLDQKQELVSGDTDGYLVDDTQSIAQTFTAGLSGALDRVDVLIFSNVVGDLTVEVRELSSGTPSGATRATTVVSLEPFANQWLTVTFAAPAPVLAGTSYALVLSSPNGDFGWRAWDDPGGPPNGPYSNGGPWSADPHLSVWFEADAWIDMAFRTYVTAAPALSQGPVTLTAFCGSPVPKSTSGTNACPGNPNKAGQVDIRLPQSLDQGVWLKAHVEGDGANRGITFEVSKDQLTWSSINATVTDASGNARFFYRPSDNRYYRAVLAGVADQPAGASSTVRIVVRSLILLRPTGCASSSTAATCQSTRGVGSATFTAIARPNRPELPQQRVEYTLQRKSGSTWVTILDKVVDVNRATGSVKFVVSFSAKGTYRLRANLQPTSVNANSFPTPWEYYTIR
jgi:hypothetical protein